MLVEPAAIHMIARYARGGLRDSQSVLDQLLSFCKDRISPEDVNFVLGCIDEDKIHGMFDSFAKKDVSSALRIVDEVLTEGKTPGEFIDQLLSCVRDLLIFSSCGQEATWFEFNASFVRRHGKSFLVIPWCIWSKSFRIRRCVRQTPSCSVFCWKWL